MSVRVRRASRLVNALMVFAVATGLSACGGETAPSRRTPSGGGSGTASGAGNAGRGGSSGPGGGTGAAAGAAAGVAGTGLAGSGGVGAGTPGTSAAGTSAAGMGMAGTNVAGTATAGSGAPGAGGTAAGAGGAGPGAAGMAMGGAGGVTAPMVKSTVPNLKVAFVGDTGVNQRAADVLKLIKTEGAEVVLHAGDLGYQGGAAGFERQISGILGDTFPYFYAMGNHDGGEWPTYHKNLMTRIDKIPEASCVEAVGAVKSSAKAWQTCTYKGLWMVLSAVGYWGNQTENAKFIREAVTNGDHLWEICLWHLNHTDMQVGGKRTEVELISYQACLDAGAIVATGHEHSYGRTLTLTDFKAGRPYGRTGSPEMLTVSPGSTFVFHSGLGGQSIRSHKPHGDDSWWATIYTSDRFVMNGMRMSGGASPGALFITFHANGDPRAAEAYFKDTRGKMVDQFIVKNMK